MLTFVQTYKHTYVCYELFVSWQEYVIIMGLNPLGKYTIYRFECKKNI